MRNLPSNNHSSNSYILGKKAEQIAVKYLQNLGYKIIACNYKTRYGEIDILAENNHILAAVEVKCRNNLNYLYDSITLKQQKRIINALQYFMVHNQQYNNHQLRFDALLIHSKNNTITFIKNAWELS